MPLNITVVSQIAAVAANYGNPDLATLEAISRDLIPGLPCPERVTQYAAHALSTLAAAHRDSEHYFH